MEFGKRLKARRTELGISVEEICKIIGKNRATIYRYEKGSIENIPLDILEPLAKALDTTPEYLMGRETPNIIQIGNKTIDVTKLKDRVDIFEGMGVFTEEEYKKLVEYAQFLLFLREKEES